MITDPEKRNQERRECENCGNSPHEYLGHTPYEIILGDEVGGWVRVWACLHCGGLSVINPTDEEIEEAEETLIEFWTEHGQITEEEARNILGIIDGS